MQARRLRTDEWALWKAIRLRALAEDPVAFGSTLVRESAYTDQDWQERAALLAKGIDRVMFVAEAGNAVVGCGGAFLESDGTPGVVSMWVEPSFRRHGAARRLLSAIEQWARRRAKDRLTLVVLEGNREAEAVYLAVSEHPKPTTCERVKTDHSR